ncbi:MerR family transcriptional regulator [Lihuaxuella thermophila]|uniref:DNA-binding transcriptional regulator, MerR family n=1 Tax=Lihuaxuella thermophila TaxID=1173111 RepID=A0A1H8IE51_9BACL|nr:MerR family transcriptional regulator [Lihuaxuella thermophila]SEN67063.1 DNA-binding transcriptional regulator, MerR family [Lihuaxuella thermophila]
MKWYKIDEVARETGLTKRTLRFYEEIGLIKPPERSEGKFRLYSEEDINQIHNVILAREVLGFSLQELQQFLALKETIRKHTESKDEIPPGQLTEIARSLEEQILMLEKKINRMQSFKNELNELLTHLHETIPTKEE